MNVPCRKRQIYAAVTLDVVADDVVEVGVVGERQLSELADEVADELAAVYKLRERGLTENAAGLIEMIKRTSDNKELIARIPEWIRVYKNS